MTNFEIINTRFDSNGLRDLMVAELWMKQWPVVYLISDESEIYIGETSSVERRFNQHLSNSEKSTLQKFDVIKSGHFNKSATLDLESFLINRFFADDNYRVMNRNHGMPQEAYYEKEFYNQMFSEIFETLRNAGFFKGSLKEIENKDLFKLSPFKSLTSEQTSVVIKILGSIIINFKQEDRDLFVIKGNPGTGKTVVAIFLMKFMADLIDSKNVDNFQISDELKNLCTEENLNYFQNKKIGIVIPQQSLRESVRRVFDRISGLDKRMVVDPFELGKGSENYDLLIVDEAHRLGQRANQSSGVRNREFEKINIKLFGKDDSRYTQLDWIRKKSYLQILLVDEKQSVRPGDLPLYSVQEILNKASLNNNLFELSSQMRIKTANSYINWVEDLLSGREGKMFPLGEYDLRFFDSVAEMQKEISKREEEFQLSRLLAGYAWKWNRKESKNPKIMDIHIPDEKNGISLKWNSTDKDWVNSKNSINEVGSIHTIQGYDLNYAGVIVGKDLRMDPLTGRVYFDRENYFDIKGKENNPKIGKKYTDEEILIFIQNIYKVLLTRGIRGTYIYICDDTLRKYIKNNFDKLINFQKIHKILNPDYFNSGLNIRINL